MSLIDRTYFVGELNIPNTHQAAIGSQVDLFIEQYEDQFLNDALGYTLYKALKAGLQIVPVAQKWTDLIEGVEYVDLADKTRKWKGLVTQPPTVLNALDALNPIDIVVGRGDQYDPTPATNSTTIPAALVGKTFIFEKRAFGKLIAGEYSVVGNILTLASGQFAIDDVYTYKAATLAINTSTGTNKKSLIANYVYYWYQRNNHTQTATTGENKAANENSTATSPALKLVVAWNEMSSWVCDLVDYLNAKKDDYAEWADQDVWCMLKKFKPINTFIRG
jgi:hypothetical protein